MISEQAPHPYDTAYLKDTIDTIDAALVAPDLNEEDRDEIEASRAYFEARYNRLQVVTGRTALQSSELAA